MRYPVDAGPAVGPTELQDTYTAGDPLEEALMLAAKAGRFDVVSQLAKELEARRLAGSNVVTIVDAKRERR